MAENSKIEWVDHTASPWHGCAEVHKGCDNCYARTMAKRNPGTLGVWGPDGTRVKSASFHANCRRWNEQAKKVGKRATVFPSICDPFEDWQGPILDAKGRQLFRDYSGGFCVSATQPHEPMDHAPHVPDFPAVTMDDLRRKLFATIDACPNLDFILLTKRPENVRRMWKAVCYVETVADTNYTRDRLVTVQFPFRKNIWLLTSVSDQATANAMIPHLLQCRDLVPVYGVSAEPLLGPIQFRKVPGFNLAGSAGQDMLRNFWVIVGGESGHGARPYDVAWARSIIAQCKAAGVLVFHKQVGSNAYDHEEWPGKRSILKRDAHDFGDGRGLAGGLKLNDPKGGDMSEWPEDLRVRQYPKVSVP